MRNFGVDVEDWCVVVHGDESVVESALLRLQKTPLCGLESSPNGEVMLRKSASDSEKIIGSADKILR